MKTDANWLLRVGTGVLALSFAFAVASCGGHGGASNLGTSAAPKPADGNQTTTTSTTATTITSASDIAKLPPDQQKLFTDPGWNQPYIQPDPATQGLPGPSGEELQRLTRERQQELATENILPRGYAPATTGSNKGVSWIAQGSDFYPNNNPPYAVPVPKYDPSMNPVNLGEYYQFAKTATPTYGCNADGSNIGNKSPANAIEDTICQVNPTGLGAANQPISYVLEGLAKQNWFQTNGNNHGGNSVSAIYQLFSNNFGNNPNPDTPPAAPLDAKFAEVSFRSDKTQYGKGPGGGVGVGPGNQCYTGAAVAHIVAGNMWKCFDRKNNAQPGNAPQFNYDILIAPADDGNGIGSANASFKSSGGTQTEYQTFYFGSVGACYGGGQIVGLTATTSSCTGFTTLFSNPAQLYNPIYGVVLKRWQQLAPPGQGAWKGPLGSPVYGPVAYNSGAPTTQPGKKWYAWGWYFETGFMWYVDNDQTLFPNAPDEAQVYTFSGSNTYCAGTYTQQLPSTFFLGNSNTVFKVNIGVTGYSGDGITFKAPFFNTSLGRYQIPMTANGATNEQVTVAANCSGYGGQPDAACNYKNVIWAWRDGSITGPFNYSVDGQNQTHTYQGVQQGKPGQNKQNIYVLRVQLQDQANNITYGDSLPMELGTASSLPDGDVLVVNAGSYGASGNYAAVIADLNSIKTALPQFTFTETTYGGSTVTDAKKYRVVLWFKGGPDGQHPTMDNDGFTNAECDDLKAIKASPNSRPILMMGQNLAVGDGAGSNYVNYAGFLNLINPVATPAKPASGTYSDPTKFLKAVLELNPNPNPGSAQNTPVSGGNVFTEFSSDLTQFNQYYLYYGSSPSTIGERYSGPNTSGFFPTYSGFATDNRSMAWTQITLFTDGITFSAPPGGLAGAYTSFRWNGGDCVSTGNTNTGTKTWAVGYPWGQLDKPGNPLSGSGGLLRWHMMRNMLAGLDSTIGSGTNGGNSFGSYSGTTEIVSVTAHQFLAAGGVNQGATNVTGSTYPDTGTYPGIDQNSYRHSQAGLPPVNRYLDDAAERGTITGDDLLNGNDLQFDFPFYAYIKDPDSSVTVNGTGTLNGDETITYGGLLLVNGGQWTRVNPAGVGYKLFATLLTTAAPPIPALNQKAAAGYYVGTAGDFGGCVRAGYGQAIPSLVFDNRDGPISFECIAHWPTSLTYSGTPATVRWSLYPSHGVNDLNNPGHYYGERTSFFTKWISDMDIDPGVTPPAGAPKRNSFSFNIPDFNYVGNLGQGRVADFNFGTIKGWDGDIDRDNTRGEDAINVGATPDDKFPARCRVFTDFAKYLVYTTYTTYPDWVPDPTSYVEGGVYLVDKGPAITKVSITDDPAKTDPVDNVSTVADHVWDVKLGFVILYGDAGYWVEYNSDLVGTPLTWSVIPGNPPNSTDPMDPVNGYPTNGAHFPTVRVTNPVYGDYVFAVRVTDNKGVGAGDLSGVYQWPNKVPLKPPFKSVVLSDARSNSPGGRDATKMKADLETIYGTGTVDTRSSAQVTAGLPAGSLDLYDVIAWPVDVKGPVEVPNRFFNFDIPWSTSGTNFSTIKTAHQNNKAAVLMIGQDSYGTGTAWISSPYFGGDLRNILPINGPNTNFWTSWYYDGSYPDAFQGQGYNIFGSAATTPNTVGNLTGLESPNDPGESWTAFAASSNFLKSVTDPANYPAGNCEHFSASWFPAFGNTYICGSFARRNVSTDQALVMFNANWGDLLTAQGSKTRAHLLENLLCAGKATSRYNSLSFN